MILCPWDSPGKNTGEGCHTSLNEVFPTQQLNPCLVSPALQVACLNAEPLGEPNIYVYICVCVCVYTYIQDKISHT